MPSKLLTNHVIRNAKSKSIQYEICDKKVRGLSLRVSPGGAKTFYFGYKFRKHNRRMTLGRCDAITLVEARQKAQRALTDVTNGIDPNAETTKQFELHSFADIATAYLKHPSIQRQKSWNEKNRILRKEFIVRWGSKSIPEISRSAISLALTEIHDASGPSASSHAFTTIRRMFNWSVEQGYFEVSPCSKMKPPVKPRKRQRALSDPEIAAIWRAAEQIGYPYGPVVQLLILTGQRRDEVAGLHWSHLNFVEQLWFQETNKAERPHNIPLTSLMLSIIAKLPRLHQELIFPARYRDKPISGFSKWKKQLDQLSGVKEWRLHDLRRTAATGMARLGCAQAIVERILNHRPKELSGIAEVYNLYDYLDERRTALSRWSQHIEETVREPIEASNSQQNMEPTYSNSPEQLSLQF